MAKVEASSETPPEENSGHDASPKEGSEVFITVAGKSGAGKITLKFLVVK